MVRLLVARIPLLMDHRNLCDMTHERYDEFKCDSFMRTFCASSSSFSATLDPTSWSSVCQDYVEHYNMTFHSSRPCAFNSLFW